MKGRVGGEGQTDPAPEKRILKKPSLISGKVLQEHGKTSNTLISLGSFVSLQKKIKAVCIELLVRKKKSILPKTRHSKFSVSQMKHSQGKKTLA